MNTPHDSKSVSAGPHVLLGAGLAVGLVALIVFAGTAIGMSMLLDVRVRELFSWPARLLSGYYDVPPTVAKFIAALTTLVTFGFARTFRPVIRALSIVGCGRSGLVAAMVFGLPYVVFQQFLLRPFDPDGNPQKFACIVDGSIQLYPLREGGQADLGKCSDYRRLDWALLDAYEAQQRGRRTSLLPATVSPFDIEFFRNNQALVFVSGNATEGLRLFDGPGWDSGTNQALRPVSPQEVLYLKQEWIRKLQEAARIAAQRAEQASAARVALYRVATEPAQSQQCGCAQYQQSSEESSDSESDDNPEPEEETPPPATDRQAYTRYVVGYR